MAISTTEREQTRTRWHVVVHGTVQGVGFRPFIYQLAHRCGLPGWVQNTGDGVHIEVEGDRERLSGFVDSIRTELPPLARVIEIEIEALPLAGFGAFEIHESPKGAEARTSIPPDVATCPDCLADITSAGNRRYGYPFTNCTNCGPRFTIIEGIPYDRPYTTMSGFAMCPACQAEYRDPMDRRFHAQPNACPVCGPHLEFDGTPCVDDLEAIRRTAEMLRIGRIMAIKGLGGFHLACDAGNTEAVAELRARKGRGGKPFGLMCASMEEAQRIAEIDPASERLLLSLERPILLLPKREPNYISALVAQGAGTFGIMLPYTPLHHILMTYAPKTLVMTSGNLSEEPIVHRDEQVAGKLGHIADHVLGHNRPIHMACDDSVTQVFDGMPMVIRRARGYVPHPIEVDADLPQVLACGSDLKNTICLTKGRLALLSQHLGDLDNVATQEHYRHVVDHFCAFFDVKPRAIAHDLHPDYRSTRLAETFDAPRIPVQHHHAHIASCMVENHLPGPVIGVAFDGTGYGTDGCIWGSEFLIADYDGFTRAASLAYQPLPGGDAAIRKPGRMALSYLFSALGETGTDVGLELIPGLTEMEARTICIQLDRGLNTPLTSSMGRLFDAVSALLGICTEVTYEGQAAIEMETRARPGSEPREYPFTIDLDDAGVMRIDVREMIRSIVHDTRTGRCADGMAYAFHETIAAMVEDACCTLRDRTGIDRVALSGGVFQNLTLLGMVLRRLNARGFQVYRHSLIPCNDGGISLGQAMVAARRIS